MLSTLPRTAVPSGPPSLLIACSAAAPTPLRSADSLDSAAEVEVVCGQAAEDFADDALDGAEADFFDGDGSYRERAHDAVVDFAGDAELLRERKSYGSDAAEHDGDGHESREENG